MPSGGQCSEFTGTVLRWGRGPAKLEPCPPNLWLQQQYAVVKPLNSYTGGGRFCRVGVVDLVVLVCVLRATTKEVVYFLPCPPLFFSRTAPVNSFRMYGKMVFSACLGYIASVGKYIATAW